MAVLTFPALFGHLIRWLDYETSHRAVIALARDAYNRPAVMWSPWATGPDGPVDPVFLSVVWKLLQKCEPPGLLSPSRTIVGEEDDQVKEGGKLDVDHKSNTSGFAEEKREVVKLSAKNFAELSGREQMSENRLRTGQNRFLLHRSYSEDCVHGEELWGRF
jgi:hypothetical protein